MNPLEIAIAMKGILIAGKNILDTVSEQKLAQELLFSDKLSPGEKQRLRTQLAKSAEDLAKAHQQIAEDLAKAHQQIAEAVQDISKSTGDLARAHQQIADAATQIADGLEKINLAYGVARTYIRQGSMLLLRKLELAEARGIDTSEIRKLLPPVDPQ